MRQIMGIVIVLILTMALAGCIGPQVPNPSGEPAKYVDATTGGPTGVGMESQDIITMTDMMMRDMLANPILAGAHTPPRVIIDEEYFTNNSSTRIDKAMITNRLRVQLNRAANGRMTFVGRSTISAVEKERELKRMGKVSKGVKYSEQTLGADYRLVGDITTSDQIVGSTGKKVRFTQINFEMQDLESGEIVWGNIYDFKKEGADDVVYR
jgi:PBP1b-binding outer membrane lipoprotein LpoB